MRRRRARCLCDTLESRLLLAVAPAVSVAFDSHFGSGGQVVTDVGDGPNHTSDFVNAAAALPGGEGFVLVGRAGPNAAAVRYRADGTPDPSFGAGGVARYAAAGLRAAWSAIAPLDAGGLLLGGSAFDVPTTHSVPLLARYNPDGSLDTTFGPDHTGLAAVPIAGSGSGSVVRSILPLPDGTIYAGGSWTSADGTSQEAALWRFLPDGTPDPFFGTGGVVRYELVLIPYLDDSFNALLPLIGGRLLAAGSNQLLIFNADGTIASQLITDTRNIVMAAAPDGRLVAAGRFGNGAGWVTRYLPDGSADPTLPVNATTGIGQDDLPRALNVGTDGRIYVGLDTYYVGGQYATIAALQPDGTLDPSFGVAGRMPLPPQVEDGTYSLLPAPGHALVAAYTTGAPAPGEIFASGNFAASRLVLDPAGLVVAGHPDGDAYEGRDALVWASDSSYAAGEIVRYEWDDRFTGGPFVMTEAGATAWVHVLDDDPAPRVVLRVTTSDGLMALSQPLDMRVLNVRPEIASLHFTPYVPTGANVSGLVYGVLIDPGLDELQTTIDFGDGTPPVTRNLGIGSGGFFGESHTFDHRGTYTVHIAAADDDGGTDAKDVTVRAVDLVGRVRRDNVDTGSVSETSPPLEGATVYLDLDDDGQLDEGEPRATTDVAGDYHFEGLDEGTYRIRVIPPGGAEGWRVTSPVDGSRLVAVSAAHGERADFWMTDRSRISGTVFEDANANGVRDNGEGGQGVVAQTLYLDLDDDGSFDSGEPRAAVFSGGRYAFGNLAPGTYKVRMLADGTFEFNQPYLQTLPAGPGGHEGYSVTVGPGEVAGGLDFGAYRSTSSVSGFVFDDRNRNGNRNVEAGDVILFGRLVYIDSDDDGTLDPDEPRVRTTLSLTSGRIDPYYFALRAGTYSLRQVLPGGWTATYPADGAAQVVTVAAGQALSNRNFGSYTDTPYAVVGRRVFYARSVFDTPQSRYGDGGPIATDKQALLPGQSASPANVTNYTLGLNGLIVDLRVATTSGLGVSNFSFATSADPTSDAWTPARAPQEVLIQPGGGTAGSDRVAITWVAGAIVNTWLRVTVLANAQTGLAAPDVFYFGHLAGDTGDGAGTFRVNALDLAGVKRALNTNVPVTSRYDFNRDGRINALDLATVRSNLNRTLPALASPPATASLAPLALERRATDGLL